MVMRGRYLWASPGSGSHISPHILLARTQSFLFVREVIPNCKGGWEMCLVYAQEEEEMGLMKSEPDFAKYLYLTALHMCFNIVNYLRAF